MVASSSRIGGLHVDTLVASVRVSGGSLQVDTIRSTLGGVELEGAGSLGLTAGAPGTARSCAG